MQKYLTLKLELKFRFELKSRPISTMSNKFEAAKLEFT